MTTLLMYILLMYASLQSQSATNQSYMTNHPSFDTPWSNVTAKEGSNVILPCSVKHLGSKQVVWTDQWSTLLTHEDRRIIDDERISVERPFTKDWNLHIRDIRIEDQGLYNCQINTKPVKIKTVCLTVQVPAKILENLSSRDKTPREGNTVTLVCNATGIPMPTVTWNRHVRGKFGVKRESEFCPEHDRIGINGEVLVIHNVSRYCGDIYECVAFNGVHPASNRLISVDVQYAPEVNLPNARIGQYIGKETILECRVEANPQAVTKWIRQRHGTTEQQEVKSVASRYWLEIYNDEKPYSNIVILSLTIVYVEELDFGKYTCKASNSFGEDAKSMELFDYSKHPKHYAKTSTYVTSTMHVGRPMVINKDNFSHHQLASENIMFDRIKTQFVSRTESSIRAVTPRSRSDNYEEDVSNAAKIRSVVSAILVFLSHCLTLNYSHC